MFCPECEKPVPFEKETDPPFENTLRALLKRQDSPLRWKGSYKDTGLELIYRCTREKHVFVIFIKISDNNIFKIGQYPSIADLQLGNIKKYDKILTDKMRGEFVRAIGLNAHGIGIGAFVYLRRIFENLIQDAHGEAIKSEKWNEELYNKSRMNERITMLNMYLPDLLVENASMYAILSIGIHELTENECLENFSILKSGIELILEERFDEKKKEEKKNQFKTEIQVLTNKHKPQK
jgi:hypothetical protein